MDEQQINKIQDELMAQIDEPLKLEHEIQELSKTIASNLYVKRKTVTDFQDRNFMLKYITINQNIVVLMADTTKYKLLNDKYIPYKATARIMPEVTELETIKGIVEALLKRVAGIIEPEEINE